MTDFDPDKLKHKPNEKHTLDEVLKSLQDLIHNDLLKGEGARAQAEAEPAPAADATPASEVRPEPESSDASLPVADVPLGTVVQSLEELVNKDLAPAADDDTAPRVPAAAEVPTPTPAPAPAATPKPATGQQMFTFDDPPPAAAEPAPVAADFDELTVELAPPPGDFAKAENEVVEETIAEPPPDLPVLTDAVAETATPPADDLPVLEEIALEMPDDSRDGGGRAASGTAAGNNPAAIAARVIARLNANRRARGEAELDDATLDALRVLLREEIERHQSER